MRVSAIVVTRGDVQLAPIIESLPDEWEILIWCNGEGPWMDEPDLLRLPAGDHGVMHALNKPVTDLAVYGRYAAIKYATGDLIFVQDDDCVLPPEAIEHLVSLAEAAPPEAVVCNMPAAWREQDFYAEHALVGFGAVFHRDAPARAFERFLGYPSVLSAPVSGDEPPGFFLRTCDVVFTALTPRVLVDVPYENLPWATADSRMYRQAEHFGERKRMLEMALAVRDAEKVAPA